MNRKRHNSIRSRLIGLNMAVLALVLVAMGVTLRISLEMNLTRAVDADMQTKADGMLKRWYALGDARRDFLLMTVRTRPSRQVAEAFQIGTMTGTGSPFYPPRVLTLHSRNYLTYSSEKPWDARAYRQSLRGRSVFDTVVTGGVALRIYSTPILRDGAVDGVAQTAQPLTEVHREISMVTRTLLALIPLGLIAVGAGSAFLADRALRPVRRMARVASDIGANDLTRRLETDSGDEFADLARTFNEMLQRLEDSFGRLEEAYRREHQFTGDVSHELRTPLTVIKANTSLALTGDRSTDEYLEAFTATDRAADTMSAIVQDLLLLARADSFPDSFPEGVCAGDRSPLIVGGRSARRDTARQPITSEIVNVGEVLESAVALAPTGSAPIVVSCTDGLAVCADAGGLQRVITNLLANSVRHTPVTGTITVAATRIGNHVEITVADTGEGIPPEHLPHVTERFYRCDTARSRTDGGVGLGLAICQSIVSAHGGVLSITSTVGVGTRVTVRLPGC